MACSISFIRQQSRVKQALPLHFIHEVTLWASPPENAVR